MFKKLRYLLALIANVFRKLWNLPSDISYVIILTFSSWYSVIKMMWACSEIVEYPNTIVLTIVQFWHSLKESYVSLTRMIKVRHRSRYQTQVSWIDQIIYEV